MLPNSKCSDICFVIFILHPKLSLEVVSVSFTVVFALWYVHGLWICVFIVMPEGVLYGHWLCAPDSKFNIQYPKSERRRDRNGGTICHSNYYAYISFHITPFTLHWHNVPFAGSSQIKGITVWLKCNQFSNSDKNCFIQNHRRANQRQREWGKVFCHSEVQNVFQNFISFPLSTSNYYASETMALLFNAHSYFCGSKSLENIHIIFSLCLNTLLCHSLALFMNSLLYEILLSRLFFSFHSFLVSINPRFNKLKIDYIYTCKFCLSFFFRMFFPFKSIVSNMNTGTDCNGFVYSSSTLWHRSHSWKSKRFAAAAVFFNKILLPIRSLHFVCESLLLLIFKRVFDSCWSDSALRLRSLNH